MIVIFGNAPVDPHRSRTPCALDRPYCPQPTPALRVAHRLRSCRLASHRSLLLAHLPTRHWPPRKAAVKSLQRLTSAPPTLARFWARQTRLRPCQKCPCPAHLGFWPLAYSACGCCGAPRSAYGVFSPCAIWSTSRPTPLITLGETS